MENLEDGNFETPLVSEDVALVEPESVCEPIPLVAEVVAPESTAPDPDPEPVITEKRQPKVKPKRRTPRNIPRFVR